MSKSNLAVAEKFYTDEEYLALEREADEKHELIDGEIVEIDRANRIHCLIVGNVLTELHFQLKSRASEVYTNKMRVRMRKGRYSYPDVVVVCDAPHLPMKNLTFYLIQPSSSKSFPNQPAFATRPKNSRHFKKWKTSANAF